MKEPAEEPPRRRARRTTGGRRASGARFFLDDVGGSLGSAPISLETLVEATPDAILFIDGERRIRYWSRGATEMFGYTREEATGAYYDLLLPPDLKASAELEALERATEAQGTVRNHLTRRVGKDGREKTISLSRTALKDESGAVVGWTAILRDVTDQVRVERELGRARSLAMLGELAATVAHEIKNPLTGIHGAIQILLGETPKDDPRREVLERTIGQVRRLDATVRDLLRFARPETPRLERRDLKELVESLAGALEDEPRFSGIQFRVTGPSELRAEYDERLFHQVFQNLLENASDAMDGRGTVSIEMEAAPGEIVVRVSDDGPGIPEDVLPRVFDPFFTTKPRGTGLGLAICRKNVEAHGGRIRARNAAPRGAVFEIRLPAASQ